MAGGATGHRQRELQLPACSAQKRERPPLGGADCPGLGCRSRRQSAPPMLPPLGPADYGPNRDFSLLSVPWGAAVTGSARCHSACLPDERAPGSGRSRCSVRRWSPSLPRPRPTWSLR